jgi:membrane protein DedA with SNARE-associated domain
VLNWICRIALEPESCVRRTEDFFIKHGAWSLIVAKFIPGLSTIAPPLAGIVGLSLPLFLLYDGLGALIWAGSSLSIGYVFSDHFEQAFFYVEQVTPTAVLITASTFIGFVSFKAVHRRRQLRRVPRVTIAQLTEKLGTDDPPLLIDIRARTGRKQVFQARCGCHWTS